MKQAARMNRLEVLLIARGNEAMTFAEVGKYLELGSRSGKASTRRQNMTLLGKILESESASMGPRLFSRGNDYNTRVAKAWVRLQWGHDFSAVEMAEVESIVMKGDARLQWGHDFSAVEI